MMPMIVVLILFTMLLVFAQGSAVAPFEQHRALIVMPTYNEAQNLASLVREIMALPTAFDILVVDDNSPDGTGEIADRLAAELPLGVAPPAHQRRCKFLRSHDAWASSSRLHGRVPLSPT
jgi:glycosyltransferase involved in cell wall biosynthesis